VLAWPAQISVAVVILMAAGAILLRRKLPAFTVAVVAYAITLLPVIGIFHNGQQITADRYSYLPCLGWAILAGGCAVAAWKACNSSVIAKGAVIVVAAGVAIMLGILTWRQAGRWRDSRTLWTYAAAVEPSFIAWNNLAMDLAKRGDSTGAVVAYRKSIAFYAGHPDSHNNLGVSLMMLENWDNAVREFQIALKLKPDLANAHAGWGYVRMKQGKFDEAIAHFETALKLAPDYQTAREYLERAKKRESGGGSPESGGRGVRD
jgi:tetratricopeptide (TPR) repeat protein